MREITITLPDTMSVKGMSDAPESLRTWNTQKWDEEFILTALQHGVSQRQGDAWSVSKKNIEKTAKIHEAIESGQWMVRERTGASAAKFDAAIAALNIQQLAAKLTREQLFELAKLAKADNAK